MYYVMKVYQFFCCKLPPLNLTKCLALTALLKVQSPFSSYSQKEMAATIVSILKGCGQRTTSLSDRVLLSE